ncbi:MAG: M48 family metalloprotease [Proteobacteria bacterium]|nr:M48 family metalloprotease [Pseudomonadota bacterium]
MLSRPAKRLHAAARLWMMWALPLLLPLWLALALALVAPTTAQAAEAAAFVIQPADDAWRAALPRDPEAATQAYLARLPAASVARSDAYFEGGYWLQLWNQLLGLAIAALLLWTRPSTALRDWADAHLRRRWQRDALYGAAYALAGWVLSLPLTVYQGFVREHAYGMATQGFGDWFGQQLIGLAVAVGLTALGAAVLYAVMRRAGARWWAWGALTTVAMLAIVILVSPLWIEPLFNRYQPVPDGPARQAVLAMARASGVPANEVYVVDASRQTTRVSANVSGLGGLAQVRLNDNLLNRSSLPEIRAVMAHEIGHYALLHMPKMLLELAALALLLFACTAWAMRRLLARFGARWRLRDEFDIASLPLLAAVLSLALFIATPIMSTLIREHETEADIFGLNLSREPLGFAEVMLKLAEYRKTQPGPVEEFVFFDHPSAHTRIHRAMVWREQMLLPPAAP